MEKTFTLLFGLCLLFHILRTVYSVLKYKNKINPKNKIIFILVFTDMVLLWITWFQMCENDPAKFIVPGFLRYIGLSLFILGFLLLIIPLFYLRGVENIDFLVTRGIYSVTRHPMYAGMICWVIGYPLFLQSLYTLLSSVLWISNILYWGNMEEKELLEKYSEYRSYKMHTIF